MVGCDLASVLAAEGGNLIPTSHKTKFVSIFYFCSVLKATSVFAYRMLEMSVQVPLTLSNIVFQFWIVHLLHLLAFLITFTEFVTPSVF